MNSFRLRRSERYSCSVLPAMNNTSSSNNSRRADADQTDRPFRRRRTTSLGKLSQFFQNNSSIRDRGGSASFQSALQDLSSTGKLMTKIAETQRRGMESLSLWAHSGDNVAIDDVMQQTKELYQMFTERQQQFAFQYEHYLKQMQKIADAERAVKDAERDVAELEEKEQKLKREIQKGVSFFRQRRGGDVYLLRQQLEEVSGLKSRAERFLSDLRAEMEVVKMFRFRNGMQGIADCYQNLAKSCQTIFSCLREIIEMVPAVANQDVRHMVYRGTPLTRDRVEYLRRSLQNTLMITESNPRSNATSQVSRRRSEPVHSVHHHLQYDSPPPPYTPSAPPAQPVSSTQQIETSGYRTVNDGIQQTCCHCGQSLRLQQSPNYHLSKRNVTIEDIV